VGGGATAEEQDQLCVFSEFWGSFLRYARGRELEHGQGTSGEECNRILARGTDRKMEVVDFRRKISSF
jgi:hypothetical protein